MSSSNDGVVRFARLESRVQAAQDRVNAQLSTAGLSAFARLLGEPLQPLDPGRIEDPGVARAGVLKVPVGKPRVRGRRSGFRWQMATS